MHRRLLVQLHILALSLYLFSSLYGIFTHSLSLSFSIRLPQDLRDNRTYLQLLLFSRKSALHFLHNGVQVFWLGGPEVENHEKFSFGEIIGSEALKEGSDGVFVIRERLRTKWGGSFLEVFKQLYNLNVSIRVQATLKLSHLFDNGLKVARSPPLHSFLGISSPLLHQMRVDFIVSQRS
jgi:hypothetical protein